MNCFYLLRLQSPSNWADSPADAAVISGHFTLASQVMKQLDKRVCLCMCASLINRFWLALICLLSVTLSFSDEDEDLVCVDKIPSPTNSRPVGVANKHQARSHCLKCHTHTHLDLVSRLHQTLPGLKTNTRWEELNGFKWASADGLLPSEQSKKREKQFPYFSSKPWFK